VLGRELLPVLEACGGGAACRRAGPWVNGARGAGRGREVLAARGKEKGGEEERRRREGKKKGEKGKEERKKGRERRKEKEEKKKGKRKEKWRKKIDEIGEEVLENLGNC
jgi:hypothetical protein